jgi:hypothetical protein
MLGVGPVSYLVRFKSVACLKLGPIGPCVVTLGRRQREPILDLEAEPHGSEHGVRTGA